MNIVNEHIQFPAINYETPNTTGYIHLAAEIKRTLPIKLNSKTKKALIRKAKDLCTRPYVLGNFTANDIVAIPNFYKLT